MKPRPARNSGTDSSCPMVAPPHRKPSWASGSRKNSQSAARDGVDAGEAADDQARPLQRAGAHQQRQHREQHQAFQRRLIELARMARQRPAAGEHHRPGHVGRAAPQFAVDEIGDAAEEQPDRPDRAGDVAERQDRNAALAREQHHGDHAAGEAAVERHAAVPQLHDLERMRGEMRQIVEQHVAGAAAEDDAERHPQHEIVEVDDGHRRLAAPQLFGADQGAGIDPAEQDAGDIGERVPADGERAEVHQHRIEGGKGNDEQGHCEFRFSARRRDVVACRGLAAG